MQGRPGARQDASLALKPASLLNARVRPTSNRWSVNPVWLPEGDRVLYAAQNAPGAPHELRTISAFGTATSGKHILVNEDSSEIAVGRHLVYSRIRRDSNIWRARIAGEGEPAQAAELFIATTREDGKARYSPDGSKIAYTSARSGSPEIWVAKADGSSHVRVTEFGGPLVGYANWSADGQRLIFYARPDGQADVFEKPVAGGKVRRLTDDPADDTMPCYSRDGAWIYFSSSRSGQVEI